jgi:hypothetical protein
MTSAREGWEAGMAVALSVGLARSPIAKDIEIIEICTIRPVQVSPDK